MITKEAVDLALDEAFRAVFGQLWTDVLDAGARMEPVSIEKASVAQALRSRGIPVQTIAEVLETTVQSVGRWV